MTNTVLITRNAQKELKKIPRHILILFDLWVRIIKNEGYTAMQKIKGYRDHSLKGVRQGQRSASLNRSWRIIYQLDSMGQASVVEVLEVNHHEY